MRVVANQIIRKLMVNTGRIADTYSKRVRSEHFSIGGGGGGEYREILQQNNEMVVWVIWK